LRLLDLLLANAASALPALVAAWIALPLFLSSPLGLDNAMLRASIPLGIVPFVLGVVGANVALVALVGGRTTLMRAQVALLTIVFAELASFVRYGLPIDSEQLRLGVAVVLVGGAMLVVAGRDVLAGAVVMVALGCQVGVLALAPQRLAAVSDPFVTEPPHVRFLRERLGEHSVNGRILGTRGYIQSNGSSSFGIAELSALLPVQPESTSIYIRSLLGDDTVSYTMPTAWGGMQEDGTPLSWAGYFERRAFYNAINVRFLVDASNGVLFARERDGLTLVHEDSRVRVFEDAAASPRAFTVDRITPANGIVDAVRKLREPGVDPRSGVVVEAPADEIPAGLDRLAVADIRPATIERYLPEAVEIRVDADGPVVLVLADAYYPGWSATVNGAPAPIRRVNAAVRGILLEPGSHQVSFRYELAHAREGLLLSGICALLALGLVASGLLPCLRAARRTMPDPLPRRAIRSAAVGADV